MHAKLAAAGLTAFVLVSPAASIAQPNLRYPEPDQPVDAPPALPGRSSFKLVPFDAEVDSFIEIVRARSQFHVSGAGLTVAVIDGGINPFHLDFSGKIVARVNLSEENSLAGDDVTDLNGHGSNVSSIIAGRSAVDGGINTGIAPAASIAVLKVFPGGAFNKLNEGLQWVLDNHSRLGISAVNMSLGNNINYTASPTEVPDDMKKQAELISALRRKNIAVVVAAGNDFFHQNSQQGMSFPAILPETVSVGAIYDTDIEGSTSSPIRVYVNGAIVYSAVAGRCTAFSQRLSERVGNIYRTDVFAPGFFVTAAGRTLNSPTGGVLEEASRRSQSIQDGTSQATPVTCGVILLLQERFRKLTADLGGDPSTLPSVDLLEQCLRDGGVAFHDDEDATGQRMDNVTSSGETFIRLNAVRALEAMDRAFRADAGRLHAQLFQHRDEAERRLILEKATILSRPVMSQSR